MRRSSIAVTVTTLPLVAIALGVVACVGEDPILVNLPADAASVDSATPTTNDSGTTTASPTDADVDAADAPNVCRPTADQNCACTGDIDLCRGNALSSADAGTTGTYDPNAFTIFTLPPDPKANVPFDLFVVTKNRPLTAPGLLKNGAICYGGGLLKTCGSPGAGCADWKVGFFRGVTEAAGTYHFAITDPRGPTGCEGPTIAIRTVVVSN